MLEKFTRKSDAARIRMDVVRHRVTSRLRSRGRDLLTALADRGPQLMTATTGRGRELFQNVTATGRGRGMLAAAVALVFLSTGALVAHAAVSDDGPPPSAVAATDPPADDTALAERGDAADRADRGERDDSPPDETGQNAPKAAGPEESPEPEPSPAETESEPEPEPAEETEESAPEPAAAPDWVHPMSGARTTSCFGHRWGAMHAGVDLAAPQGTEIRAAGAGTVTEAGWVFGGYGISVVIDHHNGYYTHYAHASEAKVSPGTSVSPGQVIALEGNTGNSTGPHLHFEVHQGMWNQVEPTTWMSNRNVHIGGC